jgi:protein-S-isoprenylcysteine O-methyltransferase Ste14
MSPLTKKALLACAQTVGFAAAIIFGAAWSFDFWEAWIYLLAFLATTVSVTLYFLKHDPGLVERRITAGPRAETERNQKIIMTFAIVLMFALWAIPGLDHRLHWSSVPVPVVLVANLLVILGILLVVYVFKENSYAASTVQVEKDQPVISTGLYAWIRHPMYAACFLYVIGTPLALGSVVGLIPALLLYIVIILRLLDEERYLTKNLSGYEAYRQKVRYRLIPKIW